MIAEADVAVVQLRLDFEIDGPHHRTFRQRERDRRRDGSLATLVDWAVSRHPVEQVDDDQRSFARLVDEVIRRRIDQAS